MPMDQTGTPFKEGDKMYIPVTVKNVQVTPTFSNVIVESLYPVANTPNLKSTFTVTEKQLIKDI